MGRNARGRRLGLAVALSAVVVLAAACGQSAAVKPKPQHLPSAVPTVAPTAPPVGPHGGIDLRVLVVTDGTPAVQAIGQQLTTEGIPSTVVNLKSSSRQVITRAYLARTLPGGAQGGNFEGIVLPSAVSPNLSASEESALAWYEEKFKVRQVDAYSPPMPDIGMNAPVYSGPLSGTMSVTKAGAGAGFGYLNQSFPFSGGPAGPALFGYLADPVPGGGATPLLNAAIPGASHSATLFMHQSNLAGERLGYPVMDGVLSAYRAVYGASAPVDNLPAPGDGAVLHDQQLWAQALKTGQVTAWVQGNTVTISGPAGLPVPVTVPAGTTAGQAGGAAFGSPYANEMSAYTTLGSQPLKLILSSPVFSG